MKFIKGITFAAFAGSGILSQKEAYASFDALMERTNADFVILVPAGYQETAQSEKINFTSQGTIGDEELIKIHFHTNEPWKVLEYCASLGEIYDIVIEDMDRQSRGLQG